MSRQEALFQYEYALKLGQKYYRSALNRGEHPFPVVLDDILDESTVSGRIRLGVINIPAELIVGVKSSGRVSALAGNFMPLLETGSEFASKWINLCTAHLSAEGLHDPITCFEYLGRFYVQEGNKRVSVLKSYGAASIPAYVTRIIPRYSQNHEIHVYYEFLHFYQVSQLYGVIFRHRKHYARLQALLGFEAHHIWTEEERRSFSAGYKHFCSAFEKLNVDKRDVLPAEALLCVLELYSLDEIKSQSVDMLVKDMTGIWADILLQSSSFPQEVSTEPEEPEPSILTKLFGVGRLEHLSVAFIYAYDPVVSSWTRAHDLGRKYLEDCMHGRLTVKVYQAESKNYLAAMNQAVENGAELIFATTPPMIDACRRIAAEHPNVKVFNCALCRNYAGIHTYYSRIYEAKFITGAIAGAMAFGNDVGYIANYPIYGVPATVNAFALGVRMTNPHAAVHLSWSCTEGDPLLDLVSRGISVISNRDASNPLHTHWALDYGTYKLLEDGNLLPLAAPYWNWGRFYEKVVLGVMNGAFSTSHPDRGINHWWGIGSGVIDVYFSDELPAGIRSLSEILRSGLIKGEISPFKSRIFDQSGILRCDGTNDLSADALLEMDWFCDNVVGSLPDAGDILPRSQDMVHLLGLPLKSKENERQEQLQ